MTAADALITVWNDKAHYLFWRPITAIREADTDGNPWTKADPDWLPLIPTPPYTEHSSGHSGLSGSLRRDAAGLLRHRSDRLDGHQQRRSDPELHAVLARRSTRSSRLVSGRGSTSTTPTSRAPRSAGRSPSGGSGTSSRPSVTTTTDGETGGSRSAARPPSSRRVSRLMRRRRPPGPSDQRLETLRIWSPSPGGSPALRSSSVCTAPTCRPRKLSAVKKTGLSLCSSW